MSLYSGVSKEVIECICKKMTADDIIKILDQVYSPAIGTIQMFVDKNLAPNGNITDRVNASVYKDGWVYPNGKYISKEIFPQAFEYFSSISYVGKSMQSIGGNNCITLPNIEGLFKLDPNTVNEPFGTIHGQNMTIPAHKHDFKFDSTMSKEITVKNGCWVWTTRGAGTSDKIAATRWTDNYGHSVNVTQASSFHSSHSSGSVNLYGWDLPVKMNTMMSTRIDSITTPVTNASTSAKISPTMNEVQALIYIGVPIL